MKSTAADLYSLQAAGRMRAASGRRFAPTALLRDQIERGFVMLRFKRELEADFCRYLRVSGRISRATLILVAFSAMVATLFIDTRWLGLPDRLVAVSRGLQIGLMLPLITAVGVYTWRRPDSRLLEPLMVLLFAGMVVGVLAQRALDAQYGFDLPVELAGVCIFGMFALARIRFWTMLPAALIAALATGFNELRLVSAEPNAYYHLFTTAVLTTLAICGGYSSEYFIRWTWLNGTMLRYLSRLDSLTGLLNRNALESALANARDHARREGEAYAVAMIDIDLFGAYNDHYGHQRGDAALQEVADSLKTHARRPQDVCGRYGGEEFVLLWMGVGAEESRALAESMREVVEAHRIEHAVSPVADWVTVSIGLCHVGAKDKNATLNGVLRTADRALYDAKRNGRNAVLSERYEVPIAAAASDVLAALRTASDPAAAKGPLPRESANSGSVRRAPPR